MEENLISEVDSTYQVFLKGNEAIHIPFKLQCFTSDVETPEIVIALKYVLYRLFHVLSEDFTLDYIKN